MTDDLSAVIRTQGNRGGEIWVHANPWPLRCALDPEVALDMVALQIGRRVSEVYFRAQVLRLQNSEFWNVGKLGVDRS